ncbi:MAG: excinuclease ABC subunit UvrC [Alphaproteobacteria bacterium]|nr:excinuclease ABC subunit UvrC [Alphaproteobacteria bacterium]
MTTVQFAVLKKQIPADAGVYKFYNQQDQIIYIGKAKNLNNRLSSYFSHQETSRKTQEMVFQIHRFEFTIVNSESDALILEDQLIKQHKPKYNIRLKDDKSYPYIVIKNEPFPRIFFTRKKKTHINDTYIGPFTSVVNAHTIFNHIKENIPLRTCSLNLTEKNIAAGKFKVCLEYHLGNCLGPCQGHQSLQNYLEGIQQIKHLLKGNLQPIKSYLKTTMWAFSDAEDFEKAAIYKKKLDALETYQPSSILHSQQQNCFDVVAIAHNNHVAYASYLMIHNGVVVQTHTIPLEIPLAFNAEEIYSVVILYIKDTFGRELHELVVPLELGAYFAQKITVPKLGDKKKLLDLAQKNADFALKENLHKEKILNPLPELDKTNVLADLKASLNLKAVPLHIECFDNSNIQGTSPVGAMVCFKKGVPYHAQYRKFHIKTVKGINDFASMKEIVFRRYKSVLLKNDPLPHLIVIDGGKGQLSSALEALNILQIAHKVDIIGLAKREEEVYFPNQSQSIKLNWDNEGLNLLRSIRDEVHRFGIQFHRQTRSINMLGERKFNQE